MIWSAQWIVPTSINSEFVWDLKTDQGLWVASGVYVWLIEAEGLGTKYGKMAIFTEVEQLKHLLR